MGKITTAITPQQHPITTGSISATDLQTVTERLHSGYYSCVRLFRADMHRVFSNCRQFNERGSDYYRCAAALEKFFATQMVEAGLEQTEPVLSN